MLLALNFLFINPVRALENVTPRVDMPIDAELSIQEANYGLPAQITVAPLFLQTDAFVTDTQWYQALYYYHTVRLGHGDIYYHYVVFQNGTVVEGNANGIDQRQKLGDESPVIIAYLARKADLDFTAAAKSAISSLVLELANENKISLDNINTKTIEFVAKEGEPVTARSSVAPGRFSRSLDTLVAGFGSKYKPRERQFKLAVSDVKLPKNPVEYGDEVIAEITVKNNSEYNLYQGMDAEPIISKTEGELSRFYVNENWLSLTQAGLMEEGDTLLAGEAATYKLRLSVPLYFGKQEESFRLANLLGEPYAETGFKLVLDVKKLDKDVVEILDTETGQLNVRESASGFSEVISRVTPGQRFIVIERTDTGWVKLDLGGGQSGWVARQYTKTV